MRVAIVGSRGVTDYDLIEQAVSRSGFLITSIISGGARGADTLALRYAWAHGYWPDRWEEFLANWTKYGKVAGRIRNGQMADEADAIIAVWDGESAGTAHMIECGLQRKLPTYIYNLVKLSSV